MDIKTMRKKGLTKLKPSIPRIAVGLGTCGIGNGASQLFDAFNHVVTKEHKNIILTSTGCFGFCSEEPLVNILLPNQPLLILNKIIPEEIITIIEAIETIDVKVLKKYTLCKISAWDHHTAEITYGSGFPDIPEWNEISFFKWQKKIVLRNCGIINPEDIDEYYAVGGYETFSSILSEYSPDQIIDQLKISRLRGRGGAGFPTWKKWDIMKSNTSDMKYIICNADEGDPGAYMNRNELESDPHMVIEGMLIGGYAMGAGEGIIYIRAEYPLAVKRIKKAIFQAKKAGLLGTSILGTHFNFHIHIVEGAGAFVCGEETALIASIEGKTGKPRPRPPFPAQKGLWGKPTNINNVETWANIPVIMSKGGDWFRSIGTESSTGTKVFSLVGKIRNTGLVEVPLGELLETIIYKTGKGGANKKMIKAVQTGGPSGGCIPRQLFHTPVDYESLARLGTIMGSGGLVVMDEENCMVDVAKYFLEFTTSESCGKCVPCREGLHQALQLLKKISSGIADEKDIDDLKVLGGIIKDTALCGLGQTGPNPVLTTLTYFCDEYMEHVNEKRCNSGICEDLLFSPCENNCPLHMNIPQFITLYKEGRHKEAFLSMIYENPLPGSTGRICHHPCETRCRRKDVDDPVHIKVIHRYIADIIYAKNIDKEVFETLSLERFPFTGKKIAIIGSGPAGLTAAFYLSLLGHKVSVYEAHTKPGGMLNFAIPEYRLPASVLTREIENIASLGVDFHFKSPVNTEQELNTLVKNYDALFLALGTQKRIDLKITGYDLKNVFSGIDLLARISQGEKIPQMTSAIIIGGGNTAIDCARSLSRLGTSVQIVYRREKEDMPALMEEVHEAEAEGIRFMFLAAPQRVLGDDKGFVKGLMVVRMKPGDYDHTGRRLSIPTNEEIF
ncbi:MAG: FAD-dependent oxidoreductase, partial [Spirochaetales bacterium]|nr:FAD-dependent oxidoreductase [Spirochaetales bacterium]